MGRHIALVVTQPSAQALAIDQLVIALARQQVGHHPAQIVLPRLLQEDTPVQLSLDIPRQTRPVRAHGLEALEDQLVATIATHQSCVTLLAAFVGAADSGHQEAPIVSFKFQLQGAIKSEAHGNIPAPPLVEVSFEGTARRLCLGIVAGVCHPDKHRIRVTVDHLVTSGLYLRPGALQNLVTAAGDRRGQTGVEETATGAAQHAVKGVHEDLDRLAQGSVASGTGQVPLLPE